MDDHSCQVLVHIDENAKDKGDLALRNVENLAAELAGSEVELVVNYAAVLLFLKSPDLYGAKVRELASRGVRFKACAKAMRAFGVTGDMLLPGIEVVPSAMVELATKQAGGWAYIKP